MVLFSPFWESVVCSLPKLALVSELMLFDAEVVVVVVVVAEPLSGSNGMEEGFSFCNASRVNTKESMNGRNRKK